MSTIDRENLLDLLDQKLSAEDLAELTFYLKLDQSNLEGTTKRGRLRSLIDTYERRGQMHTLLAAITRMRPDVIASETTYATPSPPPLPASRRFSISRRWLLIGGAIVAVLALAFAGVRAYRTGAPSNAVTLVTLNETIAREPNNADAYFNRGELYRDQGEYRSAIDDYAKVTTLRPGYAGGFSRLGLCYGVVGDYDRAIENYGKAIDLAENPEDLLSRGEIYADQGNLDSAVTDFTEAIRLDSQFARAYYARGLAYKRQKENDKAIADFEQIMTLDTDLRSDAQEELRKLGAR